MSVGPGEADAALGERVDVGGVNVIRPVATRIERSLVVGVDDDDVGLARPGRSLGRRTQRSANGSEESASRQCCHRTYAIRVPHGLHDRGRSGPWSGR